MVGILKYFVSSDNPVCTRAQDRALVLSRYLAPRFPVVSFRTGAALLYVNPWSKGDVEMYVKHVYTALNISWNATAKGRVSSPNLERLRYRRRDFTNSRRGLTLPVFCDAPMCTSSAA